MLQDTYLKIKKSIVAIVLNYITDEFPTIIGTGFFVRKDGFVLTNQHVLEKIAEIGKKLGKNTFEEIAKVLYFTNTENGIGVVPLVVARAAKIGWEKPPENYYGESPDIGFLELKDVKDCPILEISDAEIIEGSEVAIAGFPMGTETLKVPGWIHQVGPTLQKGIVGAVLPFPCKTPHAIMLDIMTQGGSSGSPIFDVAYGKVIGILYAGLNDFYQDKNVRYQVPTSLSLAIPNNLIKNALETLNQDKAIISEDKKTPLSDWLKKLNTYPVKPKDGLGMLRLNSKSQKQDKIRQIRHRTML